MTATVDSAQVEALLHDAAVDGKFLDATPTKVIERDGTCTPRTDKEWLKFVVSRRDYTAQYAPIYCQRLLLMKQSVLDNAMRVWIGSPARANTSRTSDGSTATVAQRILDMQVGNLSIVVGTLFKVMALKPNVLEQYAKEVCYP
jgi:hypothetical protein